MENCSFQTQLVSVMEILSKAALAEINRLVDGNCAVLRLEITQSQRDIDVLKKKCELMEAELKGARMRARRKGFHPPAAERHSPLVKVVLNEDRDTTTWDRAMDVEELVQPPQCADMEPASQAEPILIKVEVAEDVWRNDPQEKLTSVAGQPPCFEDTQATQTEGFLEHRHPAENPVDPGCLLPSTDSCDTFPERQPSGNQNEAELLVKHEKQEEPENNTAPLGSGHQFIVEEADGRLWSSNPGDPGFSHATQQYEQITAMLASHSGPPLSHSIPEDMGPPLHLVGKSHSAVLSKARVKRRTRVFGYKRPQSVHIPEEEEEEEHSASSQINSIGQSSLIPQPTQHQSRASAAHVKKGNEDLMVPSPAASVYSGYSRSSLARRMRTPWRSGVGEKRFSCTYCGKSVKRFCQLKEHLRSHTGEKPFSCLQCGRRFTKQCNLTRHAVVHSGEKPYECLLCGKCFTQSSSLKSHQKATH